jgi:tetratricopeptide (TPR) repeat protein
MSTLLQSVESINRAVDLLRRSSETKGLLSCALATRGLILYLSNEREGGKASFNEALETAIQSGDKSVIPAVQTYYSYLLYFEGNYAEALTYLLQAHQTIQQLNENAFSPDQRLSILEAFRVVYSALGNHEKAYEYSKKVISLKEEVSKAKFAGQLKYQEILQKESAEKTAEILRLKERELANMASSLAAQTELLGDFRADLRKIVLRPDKYEPEEVIKQVRAKLKELPCEMIDFGKFEAQFATVHPEFRARLEMKYPELTPQELKICMLMHVNLQTAAIARLTCLSERTVDNHRFNIRKKMSLKTEDNLKEHLRKLDGK